MQLLNVLFFLASLRSLAQANSEGDALFDLKQKLNASSNQLADWNQDQVNPCTWNSVDCDPNNNVVQVTLTSMGFTGKLSPRIGELKNLVVLSLQGNNITGGIPEEYGNLSSLTKLDLENNHLTGPIPSSLGKLTKLQILILSQNNLSGNIPDSFSHLTSLNDIRLAFNDLVGRIADELSQVVKYIFTDNKLNCGTNFHHSCISDMPDQGGSHGSKIGVTIGSIAGVIVILAIGLILLYYKGGQKGHRPDVFVDVAGCESQFLSRIQDKVTF